VSLRRNNFPRPQSQLRGKSRQEVEETVGSLTPDFVV
jgi:hypothetical protein